MSACDTLVRVRVSSKTKEKAAKNLERMGLTVSDAIRILLVQIGESGRLPFAVEIPNATTIQSIAELEAGKGTEYNDVKELYDDLGI